MEETSGYKVGYGKPPKSSQFKKGRSGNPKGRPRGSVNPDSLLMRELESHIIVNENGRRSQISKADALFKQIVNSALSGNSTAIRLVYRQLERVQARADAVIEAQPVVPNEQWLDTLSYEQLMAIAQGGVVYVPSDDPRLLANCVADRPQLAAPDDLQSSRQD